MLSVTGQACGLVKNLALMAYISVGAALSTVTDYLKDWNIDSLDDVSPDDIPHGTKVFVNGVWFGIHNGPTELVDSMRRLRRNLSLPIEVSIVRSYVGALGSASRARAVPHPGRP